MLLSSAIKKNNAKIIGNRKSEKTIVFGHGFGSDSTAWHFIQKALEADYRLITYDNVGAGHSISGMIGTPVSKKESEFFSKHVFMNASPRCLNDTAYKGGFEQSDLNALYQAMTNSYQSWVGGFAPATMGNNKKPELALEFASTLPTVRPDTTLAVAKAIFELDLRKEIKGFAKESPIVQSRNDIAVPMEVGEYIEDQLPNSRLVKRDAEGRFPHISAPEEVVQALQTFL